MRSSWQRSESSPGSNELGEMTTVTTCRGTQQERVSLTRFAGYFLWLGAVGFGGPIALAGHMQHTALICAITLLVLFRWKVPEPVLIGCAAGAGLLLHRA